MALQSTDTAFPAELDAVGAVDCCTLAIRDTRADNVYCIEGDIVGSASEVALASVHGSCILCARKSDNTTFLATVTEAFARSTASNCE